MIKKVTEYLDQLNKELAGRDPAIIQDALSDAEEHFSTALEEAIESTPGASEEDVLPPLIEKYGTPREIADAYLEIESRYLPALTGKKRQVSRPFIEKFFGVAADTITWGSFLYILLSGLTAILYGMWVIMGGIVSFFSLALIIGIPLTGFFLLSLRGIALLEGRIIEALLGIRMPRKPIFFRKNLNWRQKYKALTTEAHTWKIFAYLLLHLPLGLLYFLPVPLLLALSIKCALYPLWYWGLGRPLITIGRPIYPEAWMYPLVVAAGILLFFSTLHLARFIGKVHGRFAKYMLVRKQ
jgi:uncharacterized membrane protein